MRATSFVLGALVALALAAVRSERNTHNLLLAFIDECASHTVWGDAVLLWDCHYGFARLAVPALRTSKHEGKQHSDGAAEQGQGDEGTESRCVPPLEKLADVKRNPCTLCPLLFVVLSLSVLCVPVLPSAVCVLT